MDAVTALAKALHSAAMDLEDASCTCVDRSEGHQPHCVGVRQTKDYFKLAEKFMGKPQVDKVKEERRRIREGLRESFFMVRGLSPGEGGRGDPWVDAARNMYQASLRVVRR